MTKHTGEHAHVCENWLHKSKDKVFTKVELQIVAKRKQILPRQTNLISQKIKIITL